MFFVYNQLPGVKRIVVITHCSIFLIYEFHIRSSGVLVGTISEDT
jgi:hypothetical protein